jgi:DNA-binding transcriptional LysR family regulator
MKVSWDLIRTFDAVAKTGSLSAASRDLGLTQPTIGRHIDLLEVQLNVQLFLRGREGMRLTAKGADLVAIATEMTASANGFARMATGLEEDISGTVRISANDIFGVLILPNLLTEFMLMHPDIKVELSVNNAASDLLQRDADVAIRMFRPLQADLVARRVAELPLRFYANSTYLAARGYPVQPSEVLNHRLIGLDRDTSMIEAAKVMGLVLTQADFAFRCDNILAHIEAIRAGMGIGIAHVGLAAHWPEVEPVLEGIVMPPLDLWIVCHSDVRHNKRIRLIVDFLGERLKSPYAQYACPFRDRAV